MSTSKRDHIVNELSSLPVRNFKGTRVEVVCPFHPDTKPSGTVNIDELGQRAPLGWFKCWACPASASWDKYSEAVGLRPFKKGSRKSSKDYMQAARFAEELLKEEPEAKSIKRQNRDLKRLDFPFDEWREVPVRVLQKLGCEYVYDPDKERNFVWMPVNILGELRGFVRAEITKPDEGPSYVNAKGTWSRKYGLLFYDYAVRLMHKKGLSTIVLVEGPRDVIRMLRNGIPAMAVLGAENWDEEKRFTLEQADGIQNLILFFDGDDAGIRATKKIYKSVKQHFNTKYMSLWKYRRPRLDENGEQEFKEMGNGLKRLLWDNELDPFKAPQKIINKVKSALE